MESARRARVLLVATILVAASCGRDQPTAPGNHSVTGHVRLIGHLVDATGQNAGTRVVTDADGVQVELVYGSSVLARTTTIDGVYRFSNLATGGYKARCVVNGAVSGSTFFTIVDNDLQAGTDIVLNSAGDLYPVPNPIGALTTVYFALPDTQEIDIRIVSMSGVLVKTLLHATRPMGLNQVRWDGKDSNGNDATAALYWITLATIPPDVRAQLLFR